MAKKIAKKTNAHVYARFVVKNSLDDPTRNEIGANCGFCDHFLCKITGATSANIRCRFCGAQNNVELAEAISATDVDDFAEDDA